MYKKILITLLFSMFILGVNAQKNIQKKKDTTINQTDARGFKQGLWKQKDKNGNIRYVGFFKDNYPVGEFTHYYPSGKTKVIMIYSSKGQKAFAKMFYENGVTLQATGIYKGKVKDSLWKFYDDKGLLVKEDVYKNNKLNGVSKTYYPNGIGLFEEMSFKDSIKDGIWKQYFENGKLKLDAIYKNNLIEGEFKIYYPSGNLHIFGLYKESLKEGKWLNYEDNGKIKKTERYIHGVLQETADERRLRIHEMDSLMKVRIPESTIDPSLEPNSPQNNSNTVKPEDFY